MTTLYFSLVSRVYIMASKRKFCEHCEEYVTLRTHRLHADLYCHKTSEEIYSSEEEEIAGDDFQDVNVDRNMGHEAEDQGIEATSQGTKTWWTNFLCILAIKCNLSNHFVVLPIFYPKTVLYCGFQSLDSGSRHWICFFGSGAWILQLYEMRFQIPCAKSLTLKCRILDT